MNKPLIDTSYGTAENSGMDLLSGGAMVGDPPNAMSQIVERFSGQPLFIDADYARRLFSSLAHWAQIGSVRDARGEIERGQQMRVRAGMFANEDVQRYRPYRITDGVAVVPINGSLMHKWGFLGHYSAGYDAIVDWVEAAVEDSEVDGILLDFDSGGGEVAGCFDTARRLRALGEQKPIAALCNEMNASAAMCLASAAEHRFITETGVAGSVGVVMAHFSYEAWDKRTGLEVTLIYSGDQKVDGNMYQNLPEEVFERFQERIHALRGQFADVMADHLDMTRDDVLATEAAVYRGQAAIDVGFADEVVNGHDAIAAFSNYLSSRGGSISQGATMSKEDKPNGQDTTGAEGAEQQSNQDQLDTATAQATTDERQRIAAIVGHENAQGRQQLANHLAFNTSLSVEEAAAVLAAGQEETPVATSGTALDEAMGKHGGEAIESDAGDGDGDQTAKGPDAEYAAGQAAAQALFNPPGAAQS